MLPLIPVWGLAVAFLVGDRLSTAQWLGAAIVGLAVLAVALTADQRVCLHDAGPRRSGLKSTSDLGRCGPGRAADAEQGRRGWTGPVAVPEEVQSRLTLGTSFRGPVDGHSPASVA